jgi:replicative DNA helicase
MNAHGFSTGDMEQAALSSMLQSEGACAEAAECLTAEHFTDAANRTVFVELISTWSRGIPPDVILFTDHLRHVRKLDEIGGAYYISHLQNVAPTAANLRYYVDRLDEELTRRRFVQTASLAIKDVGENQEGAIPEALSRLAEIPLRRERSQSLVDAVAEKLERLEKGEPDSDIILTGILSLDHTAQFGRATCR